MDGVIIINKPKQYTSHDIVNIVRKQLNTKKVGHTGTLDPNATGVLPILIGQATKISKYLVVHKKTYIATLKLGEQYTGTEENLFYYPAKGKNIYRLGVISHDKQEKFDFKFVSSFFNMKSLISNFNLSSFSKLEIKFKIP